LSGGVGPDSVGGRGTATAGAASIQTIGSDPLNVFNVSVAVGGNRVLIRWLPPTDPTFDHVTILRTPPGTPKTVYTGRGVSFLDPGLHFGTTYRYVLVAFDRSGMGSSGVVVLATPRPQLLVSPKPGAKLRAPVLFRWKRINHATYYNLQLFLNGKKVLSIWPRSTQLTLKGHWKWGGKLRHLVKGGRYTWFVWPGLGLRSNGKYGQLLGFNSFQVVK
jgi:hypothetical protein